MSVRNILVVDDNENVQKLDIPEYLDEAIKIKETYKQFSNYDLKFYFVSSIESAKDFLKEKNIVDVLIIDYKFNNTNSGQTGVDLVKYIRDNINKHCRVIFYTMHNIKSIPSDDIINLINCKIYKLVDKSTIKITDFVLSIFLAAVECDIVVNSLERFFCEYQDILNNYQFTFLEKKMDFSDIISHIRIDDEIGRSIVDKLLHKALIDSINF